MKHWAEAYYRVTHAVASLQISDTESCHLQASQHGQLRHSTSMSQQSRLSSFVRPLLGHIRLSHNWHHCAGGGSLPLQYRHRGEPGARERKSANWSAVISLLPFSSRKANSFMTSASVSNLDEILP